MLKGLILIFMCAFLVLANSAKALETEPSLYDANSLVELTDNKINIIFVPIFDDMNYKNPSYADFRKNAEQKFNSLLESVPASCRKIFSAEYITESQLSTLRMYGVYAISMDAIKAFVKEYYGMTYKYHIIIGIGSENFNAGQTGVIPDNQDKPKVYMSFRDDSSTKTFIDEMKKISIPGCSIIDTIKDAPTQKVTNSITSALPNGAECTIPGKFACMDGSYYVFWTRPYFAVCYKGPEGTRWEKADADGAYAGSLIYSWSTIAFDDFTSCRQFCSQREGCIYPSESQPAKNEVETPQETKKHWKLSQTKVSLFVDCNFNYLVYQTNENIPEFSSRGFNDKISSIEIPSGERVILYDETDYQGQSWEVTSDTECFSSDMNDRASSMKVITSFANKDSEGDENCQEGLLDIDGYKSCIIENDEQAIIDTMSALEPAYWDLCQSADGSYFCSDIGCGDNTQLDVFDSEKSCGISMDDYQQTTSLEELITYPVEQFTDFMSEFFNT